jgi:hypothetical protein
MSEPAEMDWRDVNTVHLCTHSKTDLRTLAVIGELGSTILKCWKKTGERSPNTCLNMGKLVTNTPRPVGVDVQGNRNCKSICMVSDELSALSGI